MSNVFNAEFLPQILFFCICGIVVASDMLFRRVFNWLIVLGMLTRIAFLVLGVESVPGGWQVALTGGVLGLALFIPLYAFRAMGAGDVKFFALIGLWMGPGALLVVWAVGSGLAGLHALVLVMNKTAVFATSPLGRVSIPDSLAQSGFWRKADVFIKAKRDGRKGIPYAAYLALAAMGVMAGVV